MAAVALAIQELVDRDGYSRGRAAALLVRQIPRDDDPPKDDDVSFRHVFDERFLLQPLLNVVTALYFSFIILFLFSPSFVSCSFRFSGSCHHLAIL